MNMWPKIKAALPTADAPSKRTLFKFSRLAFAVFILVALTAASYLIYNIVHDPTIPTELLTEINATQAAENMRVTLEWGYLDAARASVGVRAVFPDHDDLLNLVESRLTTADGRELPSLGFGGGGGGVGGDGRAESVSNLNFDSSILQGESETVDLILTLTYGEMPMQFGGGGGGEPPEGFSAPSDNDENAEPVEEQTFTFEYQVSYIPAVEGQVDSASVVNDDVTIAVDNVRVAPSMIAFDICYNPPGGDTSWTPLVFVNTGYEDFAPTSEQRAGLTADGEKVYVAQADTEWTLIDGKNCGTMRTVAPYLGEGPIIITVEYLQQPIMEIDEAEIDAEIAYFAERGIELEMEKLAFGEDSSFTGSVMMRPIGPETLVAMQLTAYPETMTQDQAMIYVGARMFQQRWDGPWQFTVTVR
ncbi:MAG: hypothetical protein JXB38_04095 [Anaerolineales bacterium]|nr:hypothetical protein [Anaerolineales bacterium]